MKYLVTGGAGFIGSQITRTLIEEGAQVRVLDNFSTGKRENLQELKGRFELIEGDLRSAASLAEAVKGVEVIFHEAALVSVPQSVMAPQECFEVNVSGTSRLFEAARNAGVRRAVIASSSAVYGESKELPVHETTRLRPQSPYALSKRVNEMYGDLYTTTYGLEVVALRYFNVYGARQRPDSMYAAAVPIFIKRLMERQAVKVFGDGGQTRDLIYIRDVVAANLIAAEHPAAAGQIFNICTGHETRILDLLKVLFDLFPKAKSPEFTGPRAGDIYRSVGDARKASELLGFQAQVNLVDGLKETVEWMNQ